MAMDKLDQRQFACQYLTKRLNEADVLVRIEVSLHFVNDLLGFLFYVHRNSLPFLNDMRAKRSSRFIRFCSYACSCFANTRIDP
jgi:hypothetical protein